MKANTQCQSCGMPLRKDPMKGGWEANGAKTDLYCSYCYRDGRFTQPELSVEQMIELVESKMKEIHIPGFLARMFSKKIPTLSRWSGRSRVIERV